jgi:hypothetical protein
MVRHPASMIVHCDGQLATIFVTDATAATGAAACLLCNGYSISCNRRLSRRLPPGAPFTSVTKRPFSLCPLRTQNYRPVGPRIAVPLSWPACRVVVGSCKLQPPFYCIDVIVLYCFVVYSYDYDVRNCPLLCLVWSAPRCPLSQCQTKIILVIWLATVFIPNILLDINGSLGKAALNHQPS